MQRELLVGGIKYIKLGWIQKKENEWLFVECAGQSHDVSCFTLKLTSEILS